MINPTLANVDRNNAGPGAEIFQEVALTLQPIIRSKHGRLHHKLLAIGDFNTTTNIRACVTNIN